VRLYRSGKRVAHIAKELGIGRCSVYRAIDAACLRLRDSAALLGSTCLAAGLMSVDRMDRSTARTFRKTPLKAASALRGHSRQ
jgi:hypothetical protein